MIVGQYQRGKSTKELSVEHSFPKKRIERLLAYYSEYQEVPFEGTRPRRCLNSESQVSDIDRDLHLVNIFDEDPSYFIAEARTLLNKRTGKDYSCYAVISALDQLGLTLKAVSAFWYILSVTSIVQLEYRAKERDEQERQSYQDEIVHYPVEYLVFLDEMSTTGPKFRRRRGRFRKFEKPVMVKRLRYPGATGNSLIAACTVDRVLVECNELTSENLTREDFERYVIDRLGPHIQSYPGPNSVIVMDNCTLHHSDRVIEFIKSKGAKLIYLSPYSPDFNPIELVFGWLVQEMHGFPDTADLDYKFVFSYLLRMIEPKTMRGFFGRCGLIPRLNKEATARGAVRSFFTVGAIAGAVAVAHTANSNAKAKRKKNKQTAPPQC